MIGKLSGRIEYRTLDHVLLDVKGVGYLVYCSERTLAALPGPGEAVSLYTDLLVREDLLQLFGFSSLVEKEWHRLLTSVQGIGAKASMAILSTLGADGVGRAIALGDWNAVSAARGMGPKTAQRVVIELKDKASKVMAMGGTAVPLVTPATTVVDTDEVIEPMPALLMMASVSAQSEALSALSNLGYAPGDAASAVAQAADAEPQAETSDLIRAALRLMAPKV